MISPKSVVVFTSHCLVAEFASATFCYVATISQLTLSCNS
jgi:hypothetical protein